MKALKLFTAVVILIFTTSATPSKTAENDKKLVGIWKGFEINKQIKGIEKHWIVQRFSNGKYVIMFTTKENCEIETFTEEGKWWTKGDTFFEQQKDSDTFESYKYSIKDGLVIHFKNLSGDYEFDDYKID